MPTTQPQQNVFQQILAKEDQILCGQKDMEKDLTAMQVTLGSVLTAVNSSATSQQQLIGLLTAIQASITGVQNSLTAILEAIAGTNPQQLVETWGQPTPQQKENVSMPGKLKIRVFPKGHKFAVAPVRQQPGQVLPGLGLIVGQGDVGALSATDANGNPVNFDSTWTATTDGGDTPATGTATISGQNITFAALAVGTCTITITETSSTAGVSPLVGTVLVTVTAAPPGSPASLVITWGTPTGP